MEDLLEDRRMLVSGVMEYEAKTVAHKVPEKGIFSPVSWAMRYCGTAHEGRLYTQYSPEHGCVIRASMIAEGTDREVSNYVFYGSKQECIAWLEDGSHVDELMGIYNHLMERADKELKVIF